MLRLFAFALTLFVLTGCDTAHPDITDANEFSLRLSGAIQSDFVGDAVESRAEARIFTRPDGTQELRLRLAAAHRAEEEEVSELDIVHQFDGRVIPGTYQVADIQEQGGRTQAGFYYQFESSDLTSRYTAQGRDMVLEIVQIEDDYISGQLQVRSGEATGYRRLHGQVEEVTLTGQVHASATFEAELVE